MNPDPPQRSNWLIRYASSLRFPYLFALTAAIFLADLAIPDLIPLADEILLALATMILGSLREKRKSRQDERR